MVGVTEPNTELVDASIAELRAIHDRLATQVAGLSAEQLTGPSGASEWTVADVLSHLGSGAEIGRYPVVAAAGAPEEAPANQEIWDHWNALPPADQATGLVDSDERLVATLEALTPEQRSSLEIDLGFLPQPVPLATSLGMRLNEAALHGWDVGAGLDPAAALSEESARLLLDHFSSTMTFLLGFVGKPEGAPAARVAVAGTHSIVIDPEGVRLEAGVDGATATFAGPAEAAVRLLSGRLAPAYTPADVAVTGNVTLDELRRVFPGY
jgi:uncharacterized protein (TIGR03083 family)